MSTASTDVMPTSSQPIQRTLSDPGPRIVAAVTTDTRPASQIDAMEVGWQFLQRR